MYLIAGSYEHFIWGYTYKSSTQTLNPIFSHHAHTSPITTVASAGPAAASGGSDDSIHLYDLTNSASLGSLHHHAASITSLTFFTLPSLPSFPRNLISASEDGTLCIHDADPFVMLKSVAVHKKGINDVAVHPSGRVAITVSRDECLGMVNLVRGRRSFCCRVGKVCGLVEYGGLGGERFFLGSGDSVGVHDSEDAREVQVFECGTKVNCFAPGESGLIFTGGENGNITAWDTTSGKAAYCIENAHSKRVKGIVAFNRNDEATDDEPYMLASASSDGVIRIWDVRMAYKEKPTPLAEAFTNSRLTCLAGSSLKSSRRPQKGSNVTGKDGTKKRKTDSNDD